LGGERAKILLDLFAENARLAERRTNRHEPKPVIQQAQIIVHISNRRVTGLRVDRSVGGCTEPYCDRFSLIATDPAGHPPSFDWTAVAVWARKLRDSGVSESIIVRITTDDGVEYKSVIACMDALLKDERGRLFANVLFGTGSPPAHMTNQH
jgi:hypothetical protein